MSAIKQLPKNDVDFAALKRTFARESTLHKQLVNKTELLSAYHSLVKKKRIKTNKGGVMIKHAKKIMAVIIFVAAAMINTNAFAQAATYEIDPAHSSIGFSTKHLMVSNVLGSFGDYTGSVTYDPAAPAFFSAEATIQTKSINTNIPDRDNHLRSADFFDVEKFPTITFKSKQLIQEGTNWVLVGDLTIKGVTKEVRIPTTISGPVKGMKGDQVIGLSGETTINRQDFGVSWNKTLDQGGVVVDDNVKLIINIEAHKK